MGVKLMSRSSAGRRCFTSGAALFSCLLCLAAARAEVVTLYDGTQQAVTPDNYSPTSLTFQGLGLANSPGQTYDVVKQATYVDTTGNVVFGAEDARAGYSNYTPFGGFVPASFPALDRQAGYSINFTLEILSASQTNSSRAGVSIIAVSSDVAAGVTSSIEIGFQDGRIFALNDNFSAAAAETTLFDLVGTGFVDYQLDVAGNEFDLYANGALVLEGALQDHFGKFSTGIPGVPSPYELPNLIFLGDDTGSAVAEFNLRSLSVSTVPEPSSLVLLSLGLCGAITCGVARRRRQGLR